MPDDAQLLTPSQARFARRCVIRWLRLKEQHETLNGSVEWVDRSDADRLVYRLVGGNNRYKQGEFAQLCADIDHSALLDRLLMGGEPLPEPPPLRNAYPVYPNA